MTTHELVKPTSIFDFLFHVKRLESEIIFRTQKVATWLPESPSWGIPECCPLLTHPVQTDMDLDHPVGSAYCLLNILITVSCSEIASMCSSLCTDPPYVFTLYYTYSLFSFCMLTLYVKLDVILYILYLSFPHLHRYCIVSDSHYNANFCKAVQQSFLYEEHTSSQINSLPNMQLLTLRNLLN